MGHARHAGAAHRAAGVGRARGIVDLPCDDAAATLEQYANAVRSVFSDDLADVVLDGNSFGGFTAARIAVDRPELLVAAAR